MKRILLLRHAQSSHENDGGGDFARRLTPRGEGAAPLMGRHMAAAGRIPERVVVSAARRARDTVEGLWRDWPTRPPTLVEGELYGAAPGELMSRLRGLPDGEASVLLVGHNPAIQQTALDLAGSGDGEAYAAMRAKFPTAALAVLDAEVERWTNLGPGCAKLTAFVRPRDLEGG
ncbi:SixA phosphatase family protein [Thiohalorhabdus sp.]|uniref:SixA phosphatase family protein n=1 Tax=Thiohalorhabdus sp. TaxID=3094134 RepID=UPI002FC3586B